MFIKSILLLTLFGCIQSKIVINVSSDSSNEEISINPSGTEDSIVSHEDRNLFHIDDANLKVAVEKYYGKKPQAVFVHSPTPWGDLYATHHWEPVTRVLSVKSARVKSNTNKFVIVNKQDFTNQMEKNKITISTGPNAVENVLVTTWSMPSDVDVSEEVEYNVDFDFDNVAGSKSFSFTNPWGVNTTRTQLLPIGPAEGFSMELAPGQTVSVSSSVYESLLELEVEYKMSLQGVVAAVFEEPLNGQQFVGAPVQGVMESDGIQNEVTVFETIRFKHYYNENFTVFDTATNLAISF